MYYYIILVVTYDTTLFGRKVRFFLCVLICLSSTDISCYGQYFFYDLIDYLSLCK